jgi:hypothetical protein
MVVLYEIFLFKIDNSLLLFFLSKAGHCSSKEVKGNKHQGYFGVHPSGNLD